MQTNILMENSADETGRPAGNHPRPGKPGRKKKPAGFCLVEIRPAGHIMRWNSPWGEGFPGWHIECSAMSTKYLGAQFDIHGGGMDLLFPHHESEIAQSMICNHQIAARYWIHNNMITINGKKMGKSYNNVISLTELFSGRSSPPCAGLSSDDDPVFYSADPLPKHTGFWE